MSLENQIERLTAAIEKLNGNIERALATPAQQTAPEPVVVASAPVAAPVVASEPVASEPVVVASFTQDDLRRLCMAKVKEDRAFKDTLKEFLSKAYGVVKTSDVPDDKVAEVYSRIEAGNL
jgi:hypothetical protein